MVTKAKVPQLAGTIQILKHEDRSKPFEIRLQGTWTHVEIISLERSLLKHLKQHLVAERKSNQESKGQD